MAGCEGCGAVLPPYKGSGRKRIWCSERCRKVTLYSRQCIDCGAVCNTDGRVTEASIRCRTCSLEFGKTLEMRRAASHHRARLWSDGDMLRHLIAAADGDYLTVPMYERYRRTAQAPSVSIVIRRFGKWSRAVSQAGLHGAYRVDRAHSDRLPDAGVMAALENCAAALGREPTYSEYEMWAHASGELSGQTIRNRFGGWMAACDLVFRSQRKAA